MAGTRPRRRRRRLREAGPPSGGLPRAEGSARVGSPPRGPRSETPKRRVAELCELSPFSVFCALYLGISPDERYAPADRSAVGRRFELGPEELQSYLEAEGLSETLVKEIDFDLDSARFDIEVAPPGISRTELGRTLYEEFCEAREAHKARV